MRAVRERKDKERRLEKRKSQKKEDAGARKSRKVAKHCVFPMLFCGFGGSKSRIDEGVCGAIWSDERSKIARRSGVKHILKSKC